MVKYYFHAPNFDSNPESRSAPRLGSILADIHDFDLILNQDNVQYIPESSQNISVCQNFTDAVDRIIEAGVCLNFTAAQELIGAADMIYSFLLSKKITYNCEMLKMIESFPDMDFISNSIIASPNVQEFIDSSVFGKKKVYMVIGLKIATGSSSSTTTGIQHRPSLKISGNGAALGVPVEGGPSVNFAISRDRSVGTGDTSNTVIFAYKVVRIKLKSDGEGGKYSVDDSNDEDQAATAEWEVDDVDETWLGDLPCEITQVDRVAWTFYHCMCSK
ncbi:hypothetical protein CSAL01_03837 [Colletotrichum salicis]|uniref:Uncharacterized protein n=1 Tax=Colletotrichum salicis TaxID=1209931 RepID=A0A135UMN4_9PEZI|nr:hypothetical protein CSAL01_03837 [Colletotrichum salicis]